MPETIRERRRQWFKNGFASLADQPRSRAPRKLSDEHRARLKMWVEAEPLSSRALIIRLKTEYFAVIGKGGDGEAVAVHERVMILRLFDGIGAKRQRTTRGDSG